MHSWGLGGEVCSGDGQSAWLTGPEGCTNGEQAFQEEVGPAQGVALDENLFRFLDFVCLGFGLFMLVTWVGQF